VRSSSRSRSRSRSRELLVDLLADWDVFLLDGLCLDDETSEAATAFRTSVMDVLVDDP